MAQEPEPFSRRFGHRPHEAEITIRNEAPESLRAVLVNPDPPHIRLLFGWVEATLLAWVRRNSRSNWTRKKTGAGSLR